MEVHPGYRSCVTTTGFRQRDLNKEDGVVEGGTCSGNLLDLRSNN